MRPIVLDLRRLALAVLLASFAQVAHAVTGSVVLLGAGKLAVPTCGSLRDQLSVTLVVQAGGTWTTAPDQFSGTYTAVGRTGRKLRLALDATTTAVLTEMVAAEIANLCRIPEVTITRVRPKTLTLTVNRKLTRATLLLRYAFAGTAGGRSGSATYRVRATGPWTPQ
jgi:hypothetical protein